MNTEQKIVQGRGPSTIMALKIYINFFKKIAALFAPVMSADDKKFCLSNLLICIS